MDLQRVGTVACVAVVILGLLGAVCYGAWLLVARVEHGILAAWALGATAVVPLAAYAGYRLGGTEARGVLAGIGLGTGPVVDTAQKVADVKVQTVQRLRQPEPVIEVQLPVVDVTPRRLPSGADAVDL